MTFTELSELNLWFKLKAGSGSLNLGDIPELVSHRWDFFKNNWLSYKKQLLDQSGPDINTNLLASQMKTMDNFVLTRRSSSSNPFSNQQVNIDFSAIFSLTAITHLNP